MSKKQTNGKRNTPTPTTQAEPVATQPTAQVDPLQNLDAASKQQLLFKLLADSPDMSALLMSLAGKAV